MELFFSQIPSPDEEKYKNELYGCEKNRVEEICRGRIIDRESKAHKLESPQNVG